MLTVLRMGAKGPSARVFARASAMSAASPSQLATRLWPKVDGNAGSRAGPGTKMGFGIGNINNIGKAVITKRLPVQDAAALRSPLLLGAIGGGAHLYSAARTAPCAAARASPAVGPKIAAGVGARHLHTTVRAQAAGVGARHLHTTVRAQAAGAGKAAKTPPGGKLPLFAAVAVGAVTLYLFYYTASTLIEMTIYDALRYGILIGSAGTITGGLALMYATRKRSIGPETAFRVALETLRRHGAAREKLIPARTAGTRTFAPGEGGDIEPGKLRAYEMRGGMSTIAGMVPVWKPRTVRVLFAVEGPTGVKAMASAEVARTRGVLACKSLAVDIMSHGGDYDERVVLAGNADADPVFQGVTRLR
jgi:hypothetical protein